MCLQLFVRAGLAFDKSGLSVAESGFYRRTTARTVWLQPISFEKMKYSRHLILLSHIKTSGSGLLGLIADQDGNLDGSVLLAPKVLCACVLRTVLKCDRYQDVRIHRSMKVTRNLMRQVQIHAAQGVTNGTLLLAGNDVRIMQGVRVHLDRGDLLVTASDFAFAPAPGALTPLADSALFVHFTQMSLRISLQPTHPQNWKSQSVQEGHRCRWS
jgi:hypothetical protein